MELLRTVLLEKPLILDGSLSGWQRLFFDGHLVSEITASDHPEGLKLHHFSMMINQQPATCKLQVEACFSPFSVNYVLWLDDKKIAEGKQSESDLQKNTPEMVIEEKKSFSVIGFFSLATKLLKSAKAIKVVMAGASLAAYTWMFSLPFALTLIACLVFHEYGHLKAMKYFGMKTKGIYLIPFMGGLALGDDKINTRWQDVVISLMGPVFGLFLSLFFLLLYVVTGEVFFAGVASFNALINLFNLLPIVPLDGGHVLKSISFSMNSKLGLALCGLTAGIGVVLSYKFGLGLLGFMLVIGMLDIFIEWRTRHLSRLLPLDRYGQIVSVIWYLVTVSGFITIVLYLASMDHPVLGLPKVILQG